MISRGGPEIPLPGQPSGDRRPLRRHRPGRLGPPLRPQHPGADRRRSRRPAPTRSRSRTAGSPTAPRAGGGDAIYIRYIANPAAPAPPLQVASQGGAGQLSRPAVDGNTLLYAIATPRGSRVVQRVMGTRKHRALVRSPRLLLFDPSVEGTLVRVCAKRRAPQPPDGPPPAGARRRPGALLAGPLQGGALVERAHRLGRLRDDPAAERRNPDATIVGVSRRHPKRFQQRGPRGGGNHRF